MSALRDILAPEPDEAPRPTPPLPAPTSQPSTNAAEMPPPKGVPKADETAPGTPKDDQEDGGQGATATSAKRNAGGSVSSVYSGNKIKHLKKEDGIPLWRKDIQFDFLKLVFYDTTRCFTKYSDNSGGWTFAEIYIDAMAKSSKCSKILKEKLLQDTEGAISMAMVCLLVNVGRMNTTLNCTSCLSRTGRLC
jgi:Ino eighty subunit 1